MYRSFRYRNRTTLSAEATRCGSRTQSTRKRRGLPRYAAMANLSHDIVDQLKSMDDYQLRLENLLTINDIGAMQSAREILQQIEDSICRNCKGIINRFIATDDPDEFVDAANEAISTNRQTLCQVEDFLKTLATYASGQDDGSDAEASLELCCAQMRSMLSEEDF